MQVHQNLLVQMDKQQPCMYICEQLEFCKFAAGKSSAQDLKLQNDG